LLAAIMAASCGYADRVAAPDEGPTSSDRITPSVTASIEGTSGRGVSDSVSVRAPLRIQIKAKDNSGLTAVVTSVLADTATVGRDSTAVVPASQAFNGTIIIPWAGVRAGQVITVRTTVRDGAGNLAAAEVRATAYDPNVPRLSFVQPLGNTFAADSYFFDLAAADTAGIAKLGYRAIAPGFSRSDSILVPAPRGRADTAVFVFAVPGFLGAGSNITITPFAENGSGLRSQGAPFTVRVTAPGYDVVAPLVMQRVGTRLEMLDSIDVSVRDVDGQVRAFGFTATDAAGAVLHRAVETLATPQQQLRRRRVFALPLALRGRSLHITAFATDVAGHTGYAVFPGASTPVTDVARAKRDPTVYAFGVTRALPPGAVGGDIAVDTTRTTVYVSSVGQDMVLPFSYTSALEPMPPVAVGAQPWGMVVDNSNSLLLVANSGETSISRVSLDTRRETARTQLATDTWYDVTYTRDTSGAGYQFAVVGQGSFSGRPQHIAQSASGALYYSSRAASPATPGTLRRVDNFLDTRAEPRQIPQHGALSVGHYVILDADQVQVVEGTNGPDLIRICDHTPGNVPATATCISAGTVEAAVTALRGAPVSGNVSAAKDAAASSLALSDTSLVAMGGDRRRIVFGEGNTGGRAARLFAFFDPTGTPVGGAQYSPPVSLAQLTFNASDRISGLALSHNGDRVAVRGTGTFFADSALRYVGGYPTYQAGAGVAFFPGAGSDGPTSSPARVAFVASADRSIQIVDAWSFRQRGRIPLRENLYGPLRAALPSQADLAADPAIVVKLFGLTREGVVVIDVRRADIDTVLNP
jgi:hypothetical protein